jgi:hypothetical protein
MTTKLCECGCGNPTSLSPRTDKTRGLVKGQPYRFLPSHALRLHIGKGHRSHGQSSTPEYFTYTHAKSRCNNPHVKDFYLYGGRGIQFLFPSFESFIAVVGKRPSPAHSLDRYPNNNGNYEPGNVRWATSIEQMANTRRKRIEDFSDEELRQEIIKRRLPLSFLVSETDA